MQTQIPVRRPALLVGFALIGAFIAKPAFAQERAAGGFTVTAIAGLDQNNGPTPNGVLYGGQIGYDVVRNGLLFGVEGEITGSTAKGCETYGSSPTTINRFCSKRDRDLYLGARFGVVMGGSTSLYAKAGYSNARLHYDIDYKSPVLREVGSGNDDGFRLGAGVEHAVSRAVSLKAEYRFTDYSDAPNRNQVVGGISFHF